MSCYSLCTYSHFLDPLLLAGRIGPATRFWIDNEEDNRLEHRHHFIARLPVHHPPFGIAHGPAGCVSPPTRLDINATAATDTLGSAQRRETGAERPGIRSARSLFVLNSSKSPYVASALPWSHPLHPAKNSVTADITQYRARLSPPGRGSITTEPDASGTRLNESLHRG
ncbi:hypothetical protein BDZ89DRAFT_1145402 [Hymenopellis radicata]|nr:hypothetical protein BDZ89DRAFT_1145402 [Hymenopellis radicata]